MNIDPQAISELLQLGGQYLIPAAALLRALYSGVRGKFPEGFSQIALASLFAGLTAATGVAEFDIRAIGIEILSNTAFMAGLLSFIMIYLLRQPDRGQVVDGVVGAVIGLLSWFAWVYLLGNDWPWWTAPLVIAGGAAAFVVLRFSLRQIYKLVKVATYLIVLGGFFVLGAGAIWVFTLLSQTPTP